MCNAFNQPLLNAYNMNAQYKSEKLLIDLDEAAHQLARCMNCPNEPEKAVRALKSVFGVIRNRFTFEESLEFVGLLPLPLKAIYVDGWRVGESAPVQLHSLEELIDDIVANQSFEENWYNSNRDELRKTIKAIFQMIGSHVTEADMETNVYYLPLEIQHYLRSATVETRDSYSDTSIWLS